MKAVNNNGNAISLDLSLRRAVVGLRTPCGMDKDQNVVLDHLITPLLLAVSHSVVTGSCEQQ